MATPIKIKFSFDYSKDTGFQYPSPPQAPWGLTEFKNKYPIVEKRFKTEKERDNSHDVATGLNIVFSLFDTIVDLADDEDNDAEELAENILIFTGNQIGEEISYENDIEELKSQKEFWKNETLRLTVLSEDEEIQGLIFIPINRSAKYIKVFIPLGNTTHIYKFKQVSES